MSLDEITAINCAVGGAGVILCGTKERGACLDGGTGMDCYMGLFVAVCGEGGY